MHQRLIQLAQTARTPLLIGIGTGVAAGLSSVAQAYLLSETVDHVFLRGAGLAEAWAGLRLLLAVIGLRGILIGLQEMVSSEVGIRVKELLRARLFTHILDLGPSFSRGEKTAELAVGAVDGVEALDAYYGQYLPQLVISVLVPLTVLVLVFPVDPLSGAILLATAPLIPFFMYMIGRTAEEATARQYASLGRLSSHLLDSVQGLATLKIFGQSRAQIANIGHVADRFRELTLRVLQVSFLSAFALELLATISTAIIAVEVGLRLLYGQLVFQQALFLLILAPEFYMPLRMLGARFHAGMTGTAAARRIFDVLDTPIPGHTETPADPLAERLLSHQSTAPIGITFRAVSYTYPGQDHPALDHVDLHIAPATHVAVVGESGAGKTTLIALLLGFIKPGAGELQVGDGSPARAASATGALRIAWVPQAPHLFHDTLGANIRLGRPSASAEEVIRAARAAHLDEFVNSLPEGLEANVGEGGARLSSGEAQRLALARAFLADAPVLVLDEPTSSLDAENEALLEDSIQALSNGRTVITIAHRLNTVKRADEIIVLDGGRVVEKGTHAKLVIAGGKYSQLLAAGRSLGWSTGPPASRPVAAASAAALVAGSSESQTGTARAGSGKDSGVVRNLLGFLHGTWRRLALAALLSTLTVGSGVALMGTSAWLISAAALHPGIAALQVAIVSVRLFGISRAAFRYLERLVSHDVTFRVLRNIRVWFYARLEPLAPARLMEYRAGDLVNRAIADVDTLQNLYLRILAPVTTALAVGVAVFSYFCLQNAPEIAALFAIGFILAGVAVPLSSMYAARRQGSRMIGLRSRIRSRLVESIQGLADIVAFGRASEQAESLVQAGREYSAVQRSMARVSGAQAALSTILANVSMWVVLLAWIRRVAAGDASGLLLAPFALIALTSFEAVIGLPQAGQLWPGTLVAARRLMEIVSVPPAVEEAPAAMGPASAAASIHELEFRCVSFTYPGRTTPALREFSLVVKRGEWIAVVGPSGAGKSTLAHLLLRFWEYGAGDIQLQGASLRCMAPDDVRARIGYASQQPYMFDSSVSENLRLARRGVQFEDLERASRQAGLHDFIHGLPGEYDALIGEHGARLSAGERQRFGIARVILKEAPLWVLDEPTANLDALNEGRVMDGLFALAPGRTCLCITHRLRQMDRFDRIVVLDHGAICEQGSHGSLLRAQGLYSRLWTLQNGEPESPEGRVANRI